MVNEAGKDKDGVRGDNEKTKMYGEIPAFAHAGPEGKVFLQKRQARRSL
ncbi:MAG: hypothetical protein HFE39_05525 [Clostridiales bacterium]|nr:hypothetical protein [Clostridiales bacterium]